MSLQTLPAVTAPPRNLYATLTKVLREFGILIALLVVCAIVSSMSPHFLTYANFVNVLTQMSILGVLAVGMTLLLITGNFDLSIGATLSLGGALALGFGSTLPLGVSILIALGAGLLVGLINGVIVVKAGINSMIVTLGMMTLISGVVLLYTNGTTIAGTHPEFASFTNTTNLLPNLAWALIIIAGVMAYMNTQTRPGRYFQAAGGNPEAAELSGINVDAYKVIAFAVMGLLAAFAGVMFVGHVNSISPTAGDGFALQAIAAVIIGGTSLAGGSGSVWKSMVGVALLTVLNNGFNLLNISAYWQSVFQGAVIILSVALYTRRIKR